MTSFYGRGGSGGGSAPIIPQNVGVVAKEGYSNAPLNLYDLPDGNYNLLGSIQYGNTNTNFLIYRPCTIETVDGKKYALFTETKNEKVYDNLIELQSKTAAKVIKIEHGGGKGNASDIINDAKIGEDTTYSSKKITELLKSQENTIKGYLSWITS